MKISSLFYQKNLSNLPSKFVNFFHQTNQDLIFFKNLKFLYLSFFLFAIAFGINIVIFPSMLKHNQISPLKIGFASATETFGAIIASLILAKIITRIGFYRSLKYSSIVYGVITSILFFYVKYWLWLLFIFIIGCCWFIYSISRVSWLNILLDNNKRGIGIGLFSMIISIGVAIGPLFVKFLGVHNFLTFFLSSILTFLSFIFLAKHAKKNFIQISSKKISLINFFKNNPQCFLARFFLDYQSYSLITFTVIYGVSLGFSYEDSGIFLSSFYASGVVDLIAGFLLKKIKPKNMINFCFFGCIYSFLILTIFNHSYLTIIFIYFLFGGFIAGIFVAVYKMMNEDYQRSELISASSTFQLIGTLGSIFGSVTTGIAFQYFGSLGFLGSMIFGSCLYLAFLLYFKKI